MQAISCYYFNHLLWKKHFKEVQLKIKLQILHQ